MNISCRAGAVIYLCEELIFCAVWTCEQTCFIDPSMNPPDFRRVFEQVMLCNGKATHWWTCDYYNRGEGLEFFPWYLCWFNECPDSSISVFIWAVLKSKYLFNPTGFAFLQTVTFLPYAAHSLFSNSSSFHQKLRLSA